MSILHVPMANVKRISETQNRKTPNPDRPGAVAPPRHGGLPRSPHFPGPWAAGRPGSPESGGPADPGFPAGPGRFPGWPSAPRGEIPRARTWPRRPSRARRSHRPGARSIQREGTRPAPAAPSAQRWGIIAGPGPEFPATPRDGVRPWPGPASPGMARPSGRATPILVDS